ncbi:MAG TPA: OmpW family outer membrane protein [Verrucomicrobiae bacterium]
MNNSYKLATVGATLLLAATGGHAQSTGESTGDATGHFYMNVDGGVAFQDNTEIRSGSINSSSGDLHFDTGFRVGLEAGYQFNNYFALELESGIIRNTINAIGLQQLSSVGADASLDQVPLLVNGIFTIPLKGPIKPYIGVGVGAMAGIFSSSGVPGSGPGSNPKYNDTDITFTYQAEAGIKYAICRRLELGLAYKFIGTTDHSWHDNNINMKTDGSLTHAIVASLTWQF